MALVDDIASLVEAIVVPLIDNPDELEVQKSEEGDTIYIDLGVNADDAGKIIGRQGRIIKAIRTVARAAASKDGYQVEVELLD